VSLGEEASNNSHGSDYLWGVLKEAFGRYIVRIFRDKNVVSRVLCGLDDKFYF